MEYTLGIDFGSASVRALVLNMSTGQVESIASKSYSKGQNGVIIDRQNAHLARQYPLDYIESMTEAVTVALSEFQKNGKELSAIQGIGIDATGSTPIPITKAVKPLSELPEFKENINALAWMWKDHTAFKEAQQITELAQNIRPNYLDTIGGAYSSEWYWAKLLHCLNIDPELFRASYTWVEFGDFIPAVLAGIKNADQIKRNKCAAGHKGLYNESWGGFADEEFLGELSPELTRIRKTLPNKAFPISDVAGELSDEWAGKFGLQVGIPIAMGILDAHAGAIGSGIKKGSLIKIIGTSSCDLAIQPLDELAGSVQGVAGVAVESVLPGYCGIEAGQSAVGDIFNWFVSQVLGKEGNAQIELTEAAKNLVSGESGLLALDWNNGNRNVLTDVQLSGLVLGQSLQTKDYEIYRALIESTAFGAKRIIDQMESQGVTIDEVICCGGISQKNELFMQIYADIIGKPMKVAANEETVALGAAMMGAYVALLKANKHTSYEELQLKCCQVKEKVYFPEESAVATYSRLYELYKDLHDSFGVEGTTQSLFHIMKELIAIKTNTLKS